jgi:hypothetical protein
MFRARPLIERFWEHVEITTSCWMWCGAVNDKGYATLGHRRASRIAYELFVGPIPTGLTLDHLCHTADRSCDTGNACPHRRCVNPDHVEPVTSLVNQQRRRFYGSVFRKTHCRRGHEFTDQNTYTFPSTQYRVCKECRAASWHKYRHRVIKPELTILEQPR